ncbi:MAG TPA: hypothetical protein VGP03_09905 [Pseudonocardiaceae bacterium]|jgi:hypothetical protein|nr:hypothetical protein [Pseudonocardiaceae bacterium]
MSVSPVITRDFDVTTPDLGPCGSRWCADCDGTGYVDADECLVCRGIGFLVAVEPAVTEPR